MPLLLEWFDLLKNRQIAIEFQHGESPLQGDNQFIMKLTSCQIEFKYILKPSDFFNSVASILGCLGGIKLSVWKEEFASKSQILV